MNSLRRDFCFHKVIHMSKWSWDFKSSAGDKLMQCKQTNKLKKFDLLHFTFLVLQLLHSKLSNALFCGSCVQERWRRGVCVYNSLVLPDLGSLADTFLQVKVSLQVSKKYLPFYIKGRKLCPEFVLIVWYVVIYWLLFKKCMPVRSFLQNFICIALNIYKRIFTRHLTIICD